MFIRRMQGTSLLTLGPASFLKPTLQGKMLRKLYESFPGVHDVIVSNALTRFRIDVDNLGRTPILPGRTARPCAGTTDVHSARSWPGVTQRRKIERMGMRAERSL